MKNKNDINKKSVIRIRRKNKYFNINNILILICFVIISVMVGIISSEFVISNVIGNESLINKENIEDDTILQKQINNTLSNVSKSIVTISDKKSKLLDNIYYEENSTGVILDKEGYILTSYSKIKNNSENYVRLTSIGSQAVKGSIVDIDEELDIAIIKINTKEKLTAIDIKDSKNIKEGEIVLAVGNASSDNYVGMSTLGVISVTGEKFNCSDKEYSVIGTDAAINDKNNVGVVCNLKGQAIAIGNTKITNVMNSDGIYYGISCSQLKNMIKKE